MSGTRFLRFATCAKRPQPTDDDQLLATALAAIGIAVEACPWQTLAPGVDTPPILLRSTWDYYRHPADFRHWLEAHRAAGTAMQNSPVVALGNMDKLYLGGLEAAGIPLPHTRWLDRPTTAAIQGILAEEGWERAVLKPRISATAYGTVIVSRGEPVPEAALAVAAETGGLVQEFLPEIAAGELSLIFTGGGFSHAIRKVPHSGDFRVQSEFGGRSESVAPSAAALLLATRAMGLTSTPCLYGRVDLVETARGPLLMELELIEPELFFRLDPGAAPRLAGAVHAWLDTIEQAGGA